MPRGRKARSGDSMVELAKTLESSKARIQQLRAELESETRIAATALSRIQQLAGSLNGSVVAAMPTRGASRGKGPGGKGRRGGQREAIVSYLKGSSNPQGADAIAGHLGKKVANVRQALMQMVKAGSLVSLKKDGDSFRKPGKGERGGLYGVK